jgi:transcriptional regulator with GAF, ATPase, and Fis domain
LPDSNRERNADALAQAQRTIDRQADEIERLRRDLGDQRLAEQLRGAFALATAAGTIAAPMTHSQLLEMVVETAAHAIGAQAGALFLIDRDAKELVFEVALGPRAEEVRKLRVPLGHGIAGLVAVTAQPMAVSDARRDPRQASDIAETVGYSPDSILCVPLFYRDEVIGVLELLDKEEAESFGTADIELLGLFASLAAVAIEQSRTQRNIGALLQQVLEVPGGGSEERDRQMAENARTFVDGLDQDPVYRRSLDLARLVHEIAHRGERELQACQVILTGFADYLRSRPQPLGHF